MSGTSNLLNYILWMPILGAVLNLFIPKAKENLTRWWSLINTAITLLLTIFLYQGFDQSVPGMNESFTVMIPWIKQFHINYHLAVDGISLPMIILTSLLFFLPLV